MTTTKESSPDLVCSQHMAKFLDMAELPTYVSLAIEALKNRRFDSLAFRGLSGAVIAPPVALALHKNLIMVRKPEEPTHSDFPVEGNRSSKKYIIIDDFVSSGKTATSIIQAVTEFAPQAKCLGVLSVQHITQDKLTKHKYYPLHRMGN
jgi:adenine/guanine phosphoribosyltransferase-like PRPP-binding protein